jgi:hypothetical protein
MSDYDDGKIDYNIDNYSLEDMLVISGLTNEYYINQIYENTNKYINKARESKNTKLADLFIQIQDKLVKYNKSLVGDISDEKLRPITHTWNNPNLPQEDSIQQEKITNRVEQVEVYDNTHDPMKRKQLGVVNSYQVPVVQDTLNPNLKNSFNRFIVLDSQYRQGGGGSATSTSSTSEYLADLSDVLYKVLSIRLYSIQIPCSWYTFDQAYLNNYFIIKIKMALNPVLLPIRIEILSGNYTPQTMVTALNNSLASAAITGVVFTYNTINSKIGITFTSIAYQFITVVEYINIIFYEQNWSAGLGIPFAFNQTLGWALGFRNIIYNNQRPHSQLLPDGALDIYGPRYFIISLDDFNQNHVNNGVVTITETSKYLKIPEYYQSSAVYSSTIYGNTLEQSAAEVSTFGNGNMFNYSDKIGQSFKQTQVVGIGPDGKQTLTQPQIYTINQILKNNSINTSYKNLAPTTPDVLAIVPIKSSATDKLYVDFSGPLQDNKRVYFGPVDIERFKIRLLNDKGQLVNLNGLDWSCTINAELLYQY